MFVLALRAGDDKLIASKTLDKVLFIGSSKRVCMCMCDVVGEYKSNQMVCSAKACERYFLPNVVFHDNIDNDISLPTLKFYLPVDK